jgi:hypothetical protein
MTLHHDPTDPAARAMVVKHHRDREPAAGNRRARVEHIASGQHRDLARWSDLTICRYRIRPRQAQGVRGVAASRRRPHAPAQQCHPSPVARIGSIRKHTMTCFSMPRLACLAVLAVSMAAATSAEAGLVVQSRNFSVADVVGGVNGAFWHSSQETAQLQFDRFDESLGTLTGARWTMNATLDAFARSVVTSTAANNVFEGGVLEAHVQAGTDALHGTGGAGRLWTYQEASDSCVASKIQACAIDLNLDASLSGEIVATDLLAFLGAGQFEQLVFGIVEFRNLPLDPWSQDFSQLNMDSVAAYDLASAGGFGSLSLVYEYEAFGPPRSVPEPASGFLVGVGALMLAGVLRGRRGPASSWTPSQGQ